jgi:hypothetical protein
MSTVLAFKLVEAPAVAAPEAKAMRPSPAGGGITVATGRGKSRQRRLPALARGPAKSCATRLRVLPPLFGIALMIGIWALVAIKAATSRPGQDLGGGKCCSPIPSTRTGRTTRASAGTCSRRSSASASASASPR